MYVVLFLSISELDHGHQQLVLDGHGRHWWKVRGSVIVLKEPDSKVSSMGTPPVGGSGSWSSWTVATSSQMREDILGRVPSCVFSCWPVVVCCSHFSSRVLDCHPSIRHHTSSKRVHYRHLQSRDVAFDRGKVINFLCHANSIFASVFWYSIFT